MLSVFLVCRERFRLRYVEGWQPADRFNHRLEYGSMWHVCEEALATIDQEEEPSYGHWVEWAQTIVEQPLKEYVRSLCQKYRLQQEQVDHWYNVCKVQFPIYVRYWAEHPDVKDRTPLLAEQVFDVPYRLPSGRTVRLRGKWDSVDLVGEGKEAGVWLQENKTKSEIDEKQLRRNLTFDLQTMLYLVALSEYQTSKGQYRPSGEGIPRGVLILGVRYNVIRRPLSGGKGSIVRHKAKGNKPEETKEHFYGRLSAIIGDSPQDYFARWQVVVTPEDIARFRRECLDPTLESLYDWWEYVEHRTLANLFGSPINRVHARTPYGLWNPMAEGVSDDLDEYLLSGSTAGLTRAESLFGELQ
jgi:hypothetical protein